MHPLPRRLADGAQEGAGAALAVGAGDMHHRRQATLGMVELVQQRLQPPEAEVDQPRMQGVQPLHHRGEAALRRVVAHPAGGS